MAENTSPLDSRLGGTTPSGAMDKKLGALGGLIEQRDAVAGAPTRSAMDYLKSTEGLIKLGLSAAALLSGNEDLQAGGAGLAYGTLMGAPAAAQQELQDQQKRVQSLTAMIEKQQQQITQLLSQQPGMFVSEQGEDIVPPERMGVLMGTGIPISPAAMLNRYQRDKETENLLGFYGDMFTAAVSTGNSQGILTSLHGMNKTLGLNLTDEQLGSFMQYGPDELPAAMMAYLDVESVVQTFLKSHETGKSVWDPAVNQLRAKKPDPEGPMSVDDTTAVLVDRALELAAFKWNELPPDQRAYYTEHQEEFWEDVLVDEDAGPDGPAMVLAVKKAFPSARAGERLDEIQLEAVLTSVADINKFLSIPAYAIKDPVERGKFLVDAMRSVSQNARTADEVSRVAAANRRLQRMTQAERDALEAGNPANTEEE